MADEQNTNESSEQEERERPTAARDNPLSKPTDGALRPGFRNPANTGSKAQKKSRRKKKR